MHRQHNSRVSTEAALSQREGRPYCPKCQTFVRLKDAVWVGRRQCRCPTCGEHLERRLDDTGKEQKQDATKPGPGLSA